MSILVDIIKDLKNLRGLDVELNIIGDGPLRKNIENKIIENNLCSSINIIGYVDDVYPYINESHIYLHPADREGFGIAVIEAMTNGLHVIVSNARSLTEIVEHGLSGFIVNPYDPKLWINSILKLIDSNELYEKVSAGAIQRCKNHFNVNKFVFDHDEIYSSMR